MIRIPPQLTPMPPLRFPLSKRLRQLRPYRTKIRFRYCWLPMLLLILSSIMLFPKHSLGYCLALMTCFLLYYSYRQLLKFRLAKAKPQFKLIRQQIAQHLLYYKTLVDCFNRQREQYLDQCLQMNILSYELHQLPAFALKLLRQQQQEAYLSQYFLEASPIAPTPLLLKQLRRKGIVHAADIAKLTPKLIWNPLSCGQYSGLLRWRRHLLRNFAFCHQPLQLAKLQKQMRSHIPQQKAQLALNLEQAQQQLWLQQKHVLQQRKICLAQLLVLRKVLKKQANLVGIAMLIK